MLTDEQIERAAIAHEDFGFGKVDAHGITTHGFNPDGLRAFVRTIEAETLKAHQQAIEAAVLAEREACAQLCDKFKEGSLAAQSGSPDALANVMLRQVAVLGHSECADAIRARTQPMRIDDAHKEDA